MIINVGPAKRQRIWDDLREYKDIRVRVKEVVPLRFPVSKLIGNWSVGVGGLLTKLIGADPGNGSTFIVSPQPDL